jgi:O-antigen ligase
MVLTRKDIVRNLYDILLPILAMGIFFNLTSAIICFALISFRLIYIGRKEVAIYLLLFGTDFLGIIFDVYSLPVPGSVIAILISFLLIWDKIKAILKNNTRSFIFLFLICGVFVFAYKKKKKNDYSNEKLFSIFYNGFLTLVVFILFVKSNNISNRDIGQLLLLTSIAYYAMGLDFFNHFTPQGIFDFSFFRDSSVSSKRLEEANIGYHAPALLAMYGLAFVISTRNAIKSNKLYTVLFIATSLLAILISGARQSIFGFAIILSVFIYFNSRINKNIKLLLILLFTAGFFVFIQQIESQSIQAMFEAESIEGGLNRDYQRAFDIIQENPMLGEGLGGYPDFTYGRSQYPHNIILEILSETGSVGLLLCLIIVVIFLRKKNYFNYKTANNSQYFIIFTAFAIRTLISEDLGANIVFFSLIFSMVHLSSKPTLLEEPSPQKSTKPIKVNDILYRFVKYQL